MTAQGQRGKSKMRTHGCDVMCTTPSVISPLKDLNTIERDKLCLTVARNDHMASKREQTLLQGTT